jgi:condensin complex subunit 3
MILSYQTDLFTFPHWARAAPPNTCASKTCWYLCYSSSLLLPVLAISSSYPDQLIMPGRVTARSARPSTASHTSSKSSAPSLNSRVSTTSRISSPTISFPEDSPTTELRLQICSIFADAQKSTSGHRKLVVRLRKIQEACCYLPAKSKKLRLGSSDNYGEEDFNVEVSRCALRVLGVKKTEAVGDRVIRFMGLFLKSASEKDVAIFEADNNPEETQVVPETPTSRLTFTILSMLIPILSAKEKTVRFRATQIISHVVNSLDSIDDELYHLIRQGLIKRIRDKEPAIRVQAVMGLGRLAGNETEANAESEDSDNDMAALGLLEKLLDVLQNDTSAEVRRSLLLNLPLTPATLPYLLERARDLDGPTRRALYARLLPTLGDFRHLSLSMREKLLRWGLRDRDENVRKAAGKLFRERWIEDCAGSPSTTEEVGPVQAISLPSISGLLELLERIDVINSGVDGGIALEAMKDFWEGRPDYLEAVSFNDDFWEALSPEAAFMVRSFNDFCQQDPSSYALCEEKMPEVTRLGFYLQKYTNALLESIKSAAELGGGDEDTVEQEFIVEQLLHIAQTLDYTDEVGRRKMFSLLREALAMPDLPEEATRLTIEVLRLVCGPDVAGERDFCAVVLEAVAEVHDNIISEGQGDSAAEDSFVSAQSELAGSSTPTKSRKGQSTSLTGTSLEDEDQKIIKEIMINMKCLHIAQCMLQNVDGNLQQNLHLVTMLNNLVVPAVRSHEAPVRERGLLCLGLCCLLDRTLAEENITLFIHCFAKGHEALQATSLQILCDIITTHPSLLTDVENESVPRPAFQKPFLKSFTRALKPASPVSVQSAAATSLSKLLLTGRLNIEEAAIDDLLCTLVIAFFDPRTSDNSTLRQSLAYFLPVFCHSRLENCQRMSRVAVDVVHEVLKTADEHFTLEVEEDSDGDVDESVAEKRVKVLMATVIGMLSEWTDGRRVVTMDPTEMAEREVSNAGSQMKLAEEVLEKALSTGCHVQERKCLLGLLAKLYIPAPAITAAHSEETALFQIARRVKGLLDEAISNGIASDAAGRNTLVKIKNSVLKIVKGPTQADRKSNVRGGAGNGFGNEDEVEENLVEDVEVANEHSVFGLDEEDEVFAEPEGEATRMLETMQIEEDDNELL